MTVADHPVEGICDFSGHDHHSNLWQRTGMNGRNRLQRATDAAEGKARCVSLAMISVTQADLVLDLSMLG